MDRYGNDDGSTLEERRRRWRAEFDAMLRRAGVPPEVMHPPAKQRALAPPKLPVRLDGRDARRRRNAGMTPARRRHLTAVLIAQQDGKCALCGHPFTLQRPATLDHKIPVGGGHRGTNAKKNLQATHSDCNSAKGCRTMAQFLADVKNGRLRLPEPPEEETE